MAMKKSINKHTYKQFLSIEIIVKTDKDTHFRKKKLK